MLISDMYLDEAAIRRMLYLIDPVFREIPLYVSSTYGKTKGSGALFKIVQKQENVDFSDWTHYGDNPCVDIEPALKLGIKAVHLLPESMKEYENPGKSLDHQLSTGISRYIRSLGNDSPAGEVGSSLAGPILYPYVSWVLKESMRQGIERLYFVARDGWILWKIAEVIIREEGYPVKTSYIYGSRTAWRFPFYDGSKKDLGRILYYSNMEEILSMNDMAELFQLSLDELRKFLPERLKEIEGGKRVSKAQVDTVAKWLQENGKFRKYLVESQKEKRILVIQYLHQEIDVSNDRFGFVELSGTGFTQYCLAKLIGNFYEGKIKNFFYRLDEIQEDGPCEFFQFYPSNLKRYMLELLCRAPHGQTEGYREEGKKIIPVLEQKEGEQIKAYNIEEYLKGVLDYVVSMERIYARNGLTYVPRLDIAREYMEFIAEYPSERIARYFCHMPFSSGGRKNSMVEFAPAVSKKQLRVIYFWNNGENVRQVYHGDFIEYALIRSAEAKKYKERCQEYRKYGIGKWLTDWNRYLHTHLKPGIEYFCPWELLKGSIVIYGAGKVGRSFVKQAKQRYARCKRLLWVDSNYMELQATGMDVKSPQEIMNDSFDRVIIAIRNVRTREEIWDRLRDMGIETEKIYYG
ncbi:MAG: hypothetical protein HFG54_04605 [Lachnospiraceae bacterium]|nr:hypothetical protein [Lachnospiraceae bacterium]